VHRAPSEATQDTLIKAAKKVAASLEEGTEWRNSWAAGEADRLFCEWEAPDADTIRNYLEPAKDLLPIEALYEVQWIDPRWYE
jgi:hypothetical protein